MYSYIWLREKRVDLNHLLSLFSYYNDYAITIVIYLHGYSLYLKLCIYSTRFSKSRYYVLYFALLKADKYFKS